MSAHILCLPSDLWEQILDMHSRVVRALLTHGSHTSSLRTIARWRVLCTTFARHATLLYVAHLFSPAQAFLVYMRPIWKAALHQPRSLRLMLAQRMATLSVLSTSSRHNRKKVFVDTLYALVMRQAKCDLVELPQRSRHHYVTFVCNVMSPLALEKFGQSGIAKMNVELRKCINHATSPARAS